MDITVCPECGAAAEVQWRTVMESTDGPIEHAKVICAHRHWYLLPVAHLARHRTPRTRAPSVAATATSRAVTTSSSAKEEFT